MGGAFKIKLLVVVSVLILNAVFFASQIRAQTEETSNITVQATVSGGGGGGGSGGGTFPPVVPVNQAPVIGNVSVSKTKTTVAISWTVTDDTGIGTVLFEYGLTASYGSNSVVGGSYSTSLSSLSGNTTYYYKITATDTAGKTTTNTGSFTTLAEDVLDNTPPIISNISVSPLITSARIIFSTNESASVQVVYGLTTSLGSSASGGASGVNHEVVLLGLSPNTKYYYKIIATDVSLNSAESSVGNFTTGSDSTPPPDVSGLSISVSGNSLVLNWSNPSVSDFSGVKILRKIGSKASGPSDGSATQIYAGNGTSYADFGAAPGTTYFYTVYSYDTSGNNSAGAFVSGQLPQTQTTGEICGNGSDDDGDGKVDCLDSDCSETQQCKTPVVVVGATSACGDGIDNDGDGLIDFPSDPGCSSLDDSEEYNAPVVSVPEFAKLDINEIKFLTGNRQVQLTPISGNVNNLSSFPITIGVPANVLASLPKSIVLRLGDGEMHDLKYNPSDNSYYTDVTTPVGNKSAHLEVDYGGDQKDVVNFVLKGVGFGKVIANGQPLPGAQIVLFTADGAQVNTAVFGQINPMISDANGLFGWVIPNGDYYLVVNADGFFERRVSVLKVQNNIINIEVVLTKKPPKLLENVDPNATRLENVVQISKNLAKNTEALVGLTKQVTDDPRVEVVASEVVAPAVASAVAVGAVTLVSWADLVSLLQMIFLQPLLLFGRGKRDKWGLVYNSLSKLPVDLAIVRLINAETKKIIKTKVTGSDGKYVFVAEPGRYVLDVRKGNFKFPSELLKGFNTDGARLDIYHGEEIVVSEKGVVITANIPLDPLGEYKTPRRLIISKFLRRIQHAVSWVGLFVIIISLYIAPKWYMWILLAVNLFFMFIFRRLAKPPVAKGWGIVYDAQSKKPISNVVARLFDTKFNKLVATEVTGSDGKYFFMAGDNKYYISYERDGYETNKTDVIDLSGKSAETIARDVNLNKKK
jgi:hypothetical protein